MIPGLAIYLNGPKFASYKAVALIGSADRGEGENEMIKIIKSFILMATAALFMSSAWADDWDLAFRSAGSKRPVRPPAEISSTDAPSKIEVPPPWSPSNDDAVHARAVIGVLTGLAFLAAGRSLVHQAPTKN